MFLERIREADYADVVALANLAYRGTGAGEGQAESWNMETGLVEGPRLTEETLREDLVEKPELLVWREEPVEPGGPQRAADGDGVDAEQGRWGLVFGVADGAAGCAGSEAGAGAAGGGGGVGAGAGWAADYDDRAVGAGCVDGVV